MSEKKKAQGSREGLLELQAILEEAVEIQVDAVELEYVPEGLEVMYISGNTGRGRVLTDRALVRSLIDGLVREANLERKNSGKMRLSLKGQEYSIAVKEYDRFGESAFRLTWRRAKPSS